MPLPSRFRADDTMLSPIGATPQKIKGGNPLALCQLQINDEPAWELDHWVPVLWPWLFDAARITESRRLHATAHESASRFQERADAARTVPFLAPIMEIFEEITPQDFFRELRANPDAVLSWDLSLIEERRPFRIEEAAAHWQKFDAALADKNHDKAISLFAHAQLNPLALRGVQQLDAHELGAHALNLELSREQRAEALTWLLFGKPVSRPAKTLTARWLVRAEGVPAVKLKRLKPWWRKW